MKKLMAANWKMYKTAGDAAMTARELVRTTILPPDREMALFPPYTALHAVSAALNGSAECFLGAQNLYPKPQGAFTGEICPEMLLDAGCVFALAGHSERRHVMGESDEFVGRKVAFGLESGLSMILCVGETIDERRRGRLEEVLARQVHTGLEAVSKATSPQVLALAYEPVWAIGTGEVATAGDIAEAHTLLRSMLTRILDQGDAVRILYGGSVKPENCAEIIHVDNVGGVLVGGASLDAGSFSRIVTA